MATRIPIASSPPDALIRLADKLHEVIEQSLRTADDECYAADVDWAIERLDAVRRRLASHARQVALNLGRPGDPADGRPYYVSGVLVGPQHPMRMPIEIHTEDGVTRGSVSFDIAWEGPPGHVHGGFVAHLFDCVMGQHNLDRGIPGMTATMTVRYLRPTPLHTGLHFEVRSRRSGERKILTDARLCVGETIFAEAEGLFIVPSNFAANLTRDV